MNSTPRVATPCGTAIAWELRGLSTRAEYFDCMIAMLHARIPADGVGWNAIDLASGSAEVYGSPADRYHRSDVPPDLLATIADHPMILSYAADRGRGGHAPIPRRMSDVTTQQQLRKTQAYGDILRPLGAEHQLTILTAPVGPHTGSSWTFNKEKSDFTDADVAAAAQLQPLLTSLERAVDTLAPPYFASAPDGKPPMLTEREIEILCHTANGLTARAVAAAAGISPATVRKHLEHAYRKLGCTNKISAIEIAREAGLLL